MSNEKKETDTKSKESKKSKLNLELTADTEGRIIL
jgi:hypothetical protein